jgi:hypothetical protein
VNLKLYEISVEWQKLLSSLEESGGELTENLEAEAGALIEASEDKLKAVAFVLRNLQLEQESLEAQAKVFEAEADAIRLRAKTVERNVERLSALALPALEITGKVKSPAGTLYIHTSKNTLFAVDPSMCIAELPEKFVRYTEPELNKSALKTALKAGEPLPKGVLTQATETRTVAIRR